MESTLEMILDNPSPPDAPSPVPVGACLTQAARSALGFDAVTVQHAVEAIDLEYDRPLIPKQKKEGKPAQSP